MNTDEFESQSREAIEHALNELHTATLLAGQLETHLADIGQSIQILSQMIETFAMQQRPLDGEAES